VLTARKNHAFLLQVMQAWLQRGRDGFLIVTGEGELAQWLKSQARAAEVDKRVLFLGYLPQDELCRVFAASTAFLFPSRMEGFGMAPAEAMACSTPAIVSDRGALPEVVRNGESGYVLPVDQGAEPWLRAMERLCDDRGLRARMAAAALADVRERFSWERAGRETDATFQRVIAAHRRLVG
jgi:glycosyltransferase involved in cell wall biosynthesis